MGRLLPPFKNSNHSQYHSKHICFQNENDSINTAGLITLRVLHKVKQTTKSDRAIVGKTPCLALYLASLTLL